MGMTLDKVVKFLCTFLQEQIWPGKAWDQVFLSSPLRTVSFFASIKLGHCNISFQQWIMGNSMKQSFAPCNCEIEPSNIAMNAFCYKKKTLCLQPGCFLMFRRIQPG